MSRNAERQCWGAMLEGGRRKCRCSAGCTAGRCELCEGRDVAVLGCHAGECSGLEPLHCRMRCGVPWEKQHRGMQCSKRWIALNNAGLRVALQDADAPCWKPSLCKTQEPAVRCTAGRRCSEQCWEAMLEEDGLHRNLPSDALQDADAPSSAGWRQCRKRMHCAGTCLAMHCRTQMLRAKLEARSLASKPTSGHQDLEGM